MHGPIIETQASAGELKPIPLGTILPKKSYVRCLARLPAWPIRPAVLVSRWHLRSHEVTAAGAAAYGSAGSNKTDS
jgi:hypothetical protein